MASDVLKEERDVHLKKELGLFSGISIIVGTIIGSGIFLTPRGVLKETGMSVGSALLTWAICGVISLFGALCYAELGTTITRSGGDYSYIRHVFGKPMGFLVLWVNIIVIRPTAQAIVAMTFANYVMYPAFGECSMTPKTAARVLAALCISTLTMVNILSVKWAARIQNVFTLAKVAALIVIILTSLVLLFKGETRNFEGALEIQTSFGPGNFAMALYSGLFSYFGWNFLNFATGELKDPQRNLPLSIYISLPFVTIIYVLVNVAYFVTLTPQEVVNSDAVAVTFSQQHYGPFYVIMPIFVALSCFGGVNGLLFTSGRLNMVGAQDGMLPSLLAMVQVKWLTPLPAILTTSVLSIVMLFFDIYSLIEYVSVAMWLSIAFSIAGLIILRAMEPKLSRPLKFPMGLHFFFLTICIFLIVVPLVQSPTSVGIGILIVLTGLPVYLVSCLLQRNMIYDEFMKKFTHLAQRTLLVVSPTNEYEDNLMD